MSGFTSIEISLTYEALLSKTLPQQRVLIISRKRLENRRHRERSPSREVNQNVNVQARFEETVGTRYSTDVPQTARWMAERCATMPAKVMRTTAVTIRSRRVKWVDR